MFDCGFSRFIEHNSIKQKNITAIITKQTLSHINLAVTASVPASIQNNTIAVHTTSYFLPRFFSLVKEVHTNTSTKPQQKPPNSNNNSLPPLHKKTKTQPWKALFVSDVQQRILSGLLPRTFCQNSTITFGCLIPCAGFIILQLRKQTPSGPKISPHSENVKLGPVSHPTCLIIVKYNRNVDWFYILCY